MNNFKNVMIGKVDCNDKQLREGDKIEILVSKKSANNANDVIYSKLFKASNLSNQKLCKALEITHSQRKQFQQTKKLDLERLVTFGKKLGFSNIQMTEIFVEAIGEILKKY